MKIHKVDGSESKLDVASIELETEEGQLLRFEDCQDGLKVSDTYGNPIILIPLGRGEILIKEGSR